MPRLSLHRCRSFVIALLALAGVAAPALADEQVELGRRIYEQGVLADGSALKGKRWDDVDVSAARAACVLCHRPSGMGNVEGDIQAPPVTGNALFGTGDKVLANMDPRTGKAFNQRHQAYSDDTLAQALRSGLHADGSRMHVMMPRYELSDVDLRGLLAYLRQLSVAWSPGVSATSIRFATVVTPEVPADRRAVFIDMMRKMVAQKNGSTAVAGSTRSRHHMASAAELILGTERTWTLDVWELQGAPETWQQQLEERYRQQPVFALISGLGYGSWEPVGDFCDRQALPCWFPSVDLPPPTAPKYAIYFNDGVRLEAKILSSHLRGLADKAPRRLLQVFRDDYVGRGAAQALTATLAGSNIAVEHRVLAGSDSAALAHVFDDATASDAVMLWLRPSDLVLLRDLPPPRGAVFASGKLGATAVTALSAAWQARANWVYPYELPEKRLANLAYYRAWLNQRRIKEIDEAMQSEAYFAVAYLTDTVTDMLDNVYRDYLLERAETMISKREGAKAEYEFYSSTQGWVRTQSTPEPLLAAPQPSKAPQRSGRGALQQAGSAFGQREGTTIYPRLALGPGQRFASKGGYVVRYNEVGGLVADGAWIVP